MWAMMLWDAVTVGLLTLAALSTTVLVWAVGLPWLAERRRQARLRLQVRREIETYLREQDARAKESMTRAFTDVSQQARRRRS